MTTENGVGDLGGMLLLRGWSAQRGGLFVTPYLPPFRGQCTIPCTLVEAVVYKARKTGNHESK
eukprot:5264953-Prymnesium_polylepis.1